MAKEDKPETASPNNGNHLPEVAQELSQVASNPKKSIAILVILAIVLSYLLYTLFLRNTGDTKKADLPLPGNVVKPLQVSDNDVPTIPALPTLPNLEDSLPPILPPAETTPSPVETPPAETKPVPLPPVSLPPTGIKDDGDAKKREDAKRKSAITLIGDKNGDKTGDKSGDKDTDAAKNTDQSKQTNDFVKRGDMNLILGRGKLIDAIIENAINTDTGGEIRAIITRDVYSEWGKNILIPKGSRAFGSYQNGSGDSYGRIKIVWSRIDFNTGFSLNIEAPGVDNLGRTGIDGRVDNKFKERFANSVLNSVFNVTLARAIDTLVAPQNTTQATATQTATANNISNLANNIFVQTGLTDAQKTAQICATVLSNITDTTSSLYTTIQSTCNSLSTQASSATDSSKLSSLMSAITSATTASVQAATASNTPTKAQGAATQAFTDIGNTVKDILNTQQFKQTITIDQGTEVKIYVNKDYVFPKEAINKVRTIK